MRPTRRRESRGRRRRGGRLSRRRGASGACRLGPRGRRRLRQRPIWSGCLGRDARRRTGRSQRPGLGWGSRRVHGRNGRPCRRRALRHWRSRALDNRRLRRRSRSDRFRRGRRRSARLGACGRGGRRGCLTRGRSGLLRAVFRLDLSDRSVERVRLASDVAFGQRRTQTPQLLDQRVTGAHIDGFARRRRAGARQIGDGSHEQRMIISHKASARPLCRNPRAVH